MNRFLRPESIEEANTILAQPEKPLVYSGGTEIMADYRVGKIPQSVWMDIKQIPETKKQEDDTIGSCVFLNEIEKPRMLVDVVRGIADQTIRNHLSLGGNICGKLPYREAVLPLLALDAEVSILSNGEVIREKLRNRFDKFMKLAPGEVVLQYHYDQSEKLYHYQRYSSHGSIDYPILTYLAVKTKDGYFVGVSGYGSVPQYGLFDAWEVDNILKAFNPVTNDRASADYRKRLLKVELTKGAPDEAI